MNKFKKGFTLLELLFVAALIAILAAIILAALSSARNKGKDSSIESQMKSLQNQVELDFVGSGYANTFTNTSPFWASSDAKVQNILNSIDKDTKTHTAFGAKSSWAAQARLVQDSSKYFCVDASGKGTTSTTVLPVGNTVCP